MIFNITRNPLSKIGTNFLALCQMMLAMELVNDVPVEKIFSLSSFKESVEVVFQQTRAKIEREGNRLIKCLSINNYLKTPEEIEMDFLAQERMGLVFAFGTFNNRDGYLNIQNPERIDSGFMEENY